MSDLLQRLVDEDFGIEGRGKWYHSTDHDSLVVNAEAQTWFWNSRNLKGSTLDYLILVRGMKKDKAAEFLKNYVGAFSEKQENVEYRPYERLVDLMWEAGKTNRDYWYRRCLKDETIDRYRLGYFNGWNLIPIYQNGEFVNFQMRRDEPRKAIAQWYKTGTVFLFNEGILPFTKRIFITEGLVDSILLNQEGLPSVAAIGVNTWQPDWYIKFIGIKEIYYLEDNDAAGRIGARNIARALGTDKVKIVSFEGKSRKYDTGDFFKEGGNASGLLDYIAENGKYLFELEGAVNGNSFGPRLRWRTV